MRKEILKENLEMILIALMIVLPIRYFLIQPFVVHGSSMEPNFSQRNYLIVDELSYRFRDPQRFEVIVFKPPNNPQQYYIKRIIGLPNERVVIRNGEVKVFNKEGVEIPIKEDFLPPKTSTPGDIDIVLKENQYFLLGDNRLASYDSRNWGPITKDLIIGRVWLRLWPPQAIDIF
ncbi:MAG: signal peptidase I [Candidatus Paceibacterota bacterium]